MLSTRQLSKKLGEFIPSGVDAMTNRIPEPEVTLALNGQLLVATSRRADGMFSGSVCLILNHDESGTMGIVLNKSLDIEVGGLSKFLQASENLQHSVRFGGPNSGPILALHNHKDCAEASAAAGVYIAAHLDKLQRLLSSDDGEVRILVGQVLWKAGELEAEIAQGMWLPLPATPKIVFARADEMWRESMRELGNHYVAMLTGSTPPADVRWN